MELIVSCHVEIQISSVEIGTKLYVSWLNINVNLVLLVHFYEHWTRITG